MIMRKMHYAYKDIKTLCGWHHRGFPYLETTNPEHITCANCERIFRCYAQEPEKPIPRNGGRWKYLTFELARR